MNKRLISSELRRGFTGYGFWLALLIGCAIAVWHGCCMEGAPVGFSHAGESHYISNWVYESKEANESRVWAALAGKTTASYHNVRGVWSPDSV